MGFLDSTDKLFRKDLSMDCLIIFKKPQRQSRTPTSVKGDQFIKKKFSGKKFLIKLLKKTKRQNYRNQSKKPKTKNMKHYLMVSFQMNHLEHKLK